MKRRSSEPHRRPGRPQKFGRPSELVPVTLPTDVVRGLREIDDDLARAIVRLFETAVTGADRSTGDVELVSVADRHFLIVVDASVIRVLPGVDIIPLEGRRAFLALAPGRTAGDLELAVIDRLGGDDVVDTRERQALEQMRHQLRAWREDSALRFHSRAIVVVETATAARAQNSSRPVSRTPDAALVPFVDRRCLIVVNSAVIHKIPGVDILPLGRARAFLALAPGRLVTDLELAVIDRMSERMEPRERRALTFLRRRLRLWRRQSGLTFHARAIIVVESSPQRAETGRQVNVSRRRQREHASNRVGKARTDSTVHALD